MSNIKPFESPLPSLPQFFEKLKPVEIPQLDFGKGLITGWYHKKKLANIAEASGLEATIAENRKRETIANCDSIIEALSFGKRYDTVIARYDHELNVMALQRESLSLDNKQKEAGLYKTGLECRLLEMEVKDAGATLKAKLKELGYDNQDEDR